ncbi:hypothetical protein ES705_09371 [subsurface metagenome]
MEIELLKEIVELLRSINIASWFTIGLLLVLIGIMGLRK